MVIILAAIMAALPAVSASEDSLSGLRSLTSGFDDPLINSEDLAFYLVTHNFDAMPKGGYVEVDLAGNVYKLIPNGSAPGLCSIES